MPERTAFFPAPGEISGLESVIRPSIYYENPYAPILGRYREKMKNNQREGVKKRQRAYSSSIIAPIRADVALGYTPSGQFRYVEIYFYDRDGKPVAVNPRRIAHRDVDTADWALRLFDWHDAMWSIIPGIPSWNGRHTRLTYTLASSMEGRGEFGAYYGLRLGSGLGIGHLGKIEVIYEDGETTEFLFDIAYWILKPGTTGKDVIKVTRGEQIPWLIAMYDIASANEPYYSRALSQLTNELTSAERIRHFLVLFANKGPLRLPLVYAALSKVMQQLPVNRVWNIISDFYKTYQPSSRNRIAAIRLLGELGGGKARKVLRDIYREDKNRKSRREIVKALSANNARRAIKKGYLPVKLDLPSYRIGGPPEILSTDRSRLAVTMKGREYKLVFEERGAERFIHLYPVVGRDVQLGMVAIEWREDVGSADIKALRIFIHSYEERLARQFKYLLFTAALRYVIDRLRVQGAQIKVYPSSFADSHTAYNLALLRELGFYPDKEITAELAQKVLGRAVYVRVLDKGGIKRDLPYIGIDTSDVIPLFLKGKRNGEVVDDRIVTNSRKYYGLIEKRNALVKIMQTQKVYVGTPHRYVGDSDRSLLSRVP